MQRTVIDKDMTVIDAALLYCGDASAAYDIAQDSGVDITATLAAGMEIDFPDAVREDVAQQLRRWPMQPAAGITDEDYYRLRTGQDPPTTEPETPPQEEA